MKPWRWYRGRMRHAVVKGEPVGGTGRRKHHGRKCPEGKCNWCLPRIDWVRSTERAAVRKEARDDG